MVDCCDAGSAFAESATIPEPEFPFYRQTKIKYLLGIITAIVIMATILLRRHIVNHCVHLEAASLSVVQNITC